MAAPSLRARLLRAGLLGGVLVSLLAAGLLGEAFRVMAERAQVRALEHELAAVVGRLEADPAGRLDMPDPPAGPDYQRVFSGHYWQVGDDADGFASRSLWDFRAVFAQPATDRAELLRIDGPAGQSLRVLRQAVRVPRRTAPVAVWVGVDETPLRDDVRAFRGFTLVAVGLLFALLASMLALQVRLGLRPLEALADRLAQVRRGERERLGSRELPAELQPLADHLDALLDHHERSIARARTAAADLAHALKTPLAALDAAAQRPGPALADSVREQCARMQAVIGRQLQTTLASDFRARTELRPAATAMVELMRRVHAGRALRIDAELPEALRVPCASADLQELLGNLLDNACKWARSTVRLRAGSDHDRVWIEVADDGPGLDAAAATAARRRGVRLDQQVPGSGLGLAIVDDILQALQGELQLGRSELGGLRARIELPLPQ